MEGENTNSDTLKAWIKIPIKEPTQLLKTFFTKKELELIITKHWTPRLINNIQAHRTRSAINEIKNQSQLSWQQI